MDDIKSSDLGHAGGGDLDNTNNTRKDDLIKTDAGASYTIIDHDGSPARLYESGQVRDITGRKVLVMAESVRQHTIKNSDQGRALARKRQEKMAAALRAEIIAAFRRSGKLAVSDSAAAFGISGGLLFEDIVLNPDSYPRDRLAAWEKLGKYAGVMDETSGESGVSGGDSGDLRSILADLAAIARAAVHVSGDD